MFLDKNPKTRPLVKRFLALEDRLLGPAFPTMKRVKQETNDFCGPAVLVSLLSFLGTKASQRKIVASLRAQNKIRRFGLSVRDLAKGVRIAGKGNFVFWRKQNAKTGDLERVINKYKYPVGVEWQGVFHEFSDEDNGHYAILTRFDKGTKRLRIADPFHAFAGIDRKFAVRDFTKRWWDENLVKGRVLRDNKVMFVITPKKDSWPKKLGMKKV